MQRCGSVAVAATTVATAAVTATAVATTTVAATAAAVTAQDLGSGFDNLAGVGPFRNGFFGCHGQNVHLLRCHSCKEDNNAARLVTELVSHAAKGRYIIDLYFINEDRNPLDILYFISGGLRGSGNQFLFKFSRVMLFCFQFILKRFDPAQ